MPGLVFIRDPVEVGLGAKDQRIPVHSRRSHESAVELVGGQHLEFRLGRDDGGLALFTQKENAFPVCDR